MSNKKADPDQMPYSVAIDQGLHCCSSHSVKTLRVNVVPQIFKHANTLFAPNIQTHTTIVFTTNIQALCSINEKHTG